MSAFPPQGQNPSQNPPQYSVAPATRTRAAAVTSLICGILGCVPFITGILAVLTGAIGIAATKNPLVKGRGMAIVGLILGLISLGVWSLGFTGIYAAYQRVMHGPENQFAQQYLTDLSTGNIDAAKSKSSDSLKPQVDAVALQIKPWGALKSVNAPGFNVNDNNGKFTGAIFGKCEFANGTHSFAIELLKDSAGNLIADKVELDGVPAGFPTTVPSAP